MTVYSLPERAYPLQFTDNFNMHFWRRLAHASVDVLLQDELNHLSLCLGNYWLRSVVTYPIVSIVHHLKSDENRGRFQNALIRGAEALFLRSVDGYVCNSKTTLRSAKKVGGDAPSVVAYPGGDRLKAAMTEEEVVSRAQQPGPLRLIFVGNVTPRKGLHTVIEALATVEDVNWKLDIVGTLSDETYAWRLQQMVDSSGLGNRIQFLGRVSDTQLRSRMRGSHVFVMPSTHEGFGIAYMEAFSFGMPVIANQKGGQTEFISKGKNGVLLNPNDRSQLRFWVERLTNKRRELAEMSVAALERFQRHPSWEDSAATVRAYLQSVVEKSYA